jgi:hypothetical protein
MIILQTVGLLGRVISSSQGLYLNTGQHKYRINAYTHINIHGLCAIRTHEPVFRAREVSSCLRQLGCRDRHSHVTCNKIRGPNLLMVGTLPFTKSIKCSILMMKWREEDLSYTNHRDEENGRACEVWIGGTENLGLQMKNYEWKGWQEWNKAS